MFLDQLILKDTSTFSPLRHSGNSIRAAEILKIKNLFQRDELHIRLDSLDVLKSNELTKGTIIASNFLPIVLIV